jgi:hypothetical protein
MKGPILLYLPLHIANWVRFIYMHKGWNGFLSFVREYRAKIDRTFEEIDKEKIDEEDEDENSFCYYSI